MTAETDLWATPDTIDLGGEARLELQGCESPGNGWVTLAYSGPAGREPYHLVETTYYEGGGWIVVNARSRTWQPVRGRPALSPDGRWLATAVADLEAGYRTNHVDVWSVGADSLILATSHEGGDEWGGVGATWASATRLEFVRVSWKTEGTSEIYLDSVPGAMTLVDGVWADEQAN